jgi:hypothetical protein
LPDKGKSGRDVMGTSTLVALALFTLFLVYISARNRLPQYLAVLFGAVSQQNDAPASGAGTAAGAVGGAAGLVGDVTKLFQPGTGAAPATVFSPGSDTALTGGFSIGQF